MKLKVYLLRITAGVLAFVFGVSVLGAGRYLSSCFGAEKPKALIEKTEKPTAAVTAESVKPAADFAAQIPKPAETEKISDWEFDGSGEFTIADEVSKEFSDFVLLSITARDYDKTSHENPYGEPIPPEGFLETKRKYKFKRISIGNTKLAFETEAKDGISYKFTGDFPKEWEYDEKLEVSIVFKGRLTKMRGGKKISSIKVRFALDESCGC